MSNLLSLVKTTHQRELYLLYLDRCLKHRLLDTQGLTDSLGAINASLGLQSSEDVTPEVVQKAKNTLLDSKVIKITVNTILSDQFIDRLYKILFKQDEGLLDIELSLTSVGGFILYKDGEIYNFTFDTLISQLFTSDTFKQQIKTYL